MTLVNIEQCPSYDGLPLSHSLIICIFRIFTIAAAAARIIQRSGQLRISKKNIKLNLFEAKLIVKLHKLHRHILKFNK